MTGTITSRYYPEAAKRFAIDAAGCTMRVLHDDGLYRHLRFRRPDTSMYWFDVVTWPGHLTIVGDCGSYTWARIEDMLQFFDEGDINPGYWQEKLRGDTTRAVRYSSEKFQRIVEEAWTDYVDEHPDVPLMELRAELQDDVLDAAEYQQEAMAAVANFNSHGLQFHDFWEWDVQDFDWHYLWCCFAVRHAAQVYRHGAPPPAPHPTTVLAAQPSDSTDPVVVTLQTVGGVL